MMLFLKLPWHTYFFTVFYYKVYNVINYIILYKLYTIILNDVETSFFPVFTILFNFNTF